MRALAALLLLADASLAAYTAKGCWNYGAAQNVSESTLGAVRCCSGDDGGCESQYFSWSSFSMKCYSDNVSYAAAEEMCYEHDQRLCTLAELKRGDCCGTGCGYDARPVWFDNCAKQPCEHGTCVGSASGYTCTCEEEYTGENCETLLYLAFSRYTLDGDFQDSGPAENNLAERFTADEDYMCGGSLRVMSGEYYRWRDPDMVPLGAEPWTMAIYAKVVTAPSDARFFMHLGAGQDEEGAHHGVAFGVDASLQPIVDLYDTRTSDGSTLYRTVSTTQLDFAWHHYTLAYDGTTVQLAVDETPVESWAVGAMDLVQKSDDGTMSIGARQTTDEGTGRSGEFLFDEAVFGLGVLPAATLRADCVVTSGVFSRYALDGSWTDSGPAGNSLQTKFIGDDDAVCGRSLELDDGDYYAFDYPNSVPTGAEPWTMALYARVIEAPSTVRYFMHLGGDQDLAGPYHGVAFGLESSLRPVFVVYDSRNEDGSPRYLYASVSPVDYAWHHYAATYDGETLRYYVDEALENEWSIGVMDLVRTSELGTMSIGDRQRGEGGSGRSGEFLLDEVVFGAGVLGFAEMRAPCIVVAGVFSRYPLDGDLVDVAQAGNNLSVMYTPDVDAICGGSLPVHDQDRYVFDNPYSVPLGADPWTLAIYVKALTVPETARYFMHLGGGQDLSGGFHGIGFGVDSNMNLILVLYDSRTEDGSPRYVTVSNRVIDMEWHHYVLVYDGTTLRFYVDEAVENEWQVTMDLVRSSDDGSMALGDRQTDDEISGRRGEFLFDEAVFGNGVVAMVVLRAPCMTGAPATPSPETMTPLPEQLATTAPTTAMPTTDVPPLPPLDEASPEDTPLEAPVDLSSA